MAYNAREAIGYPDGSSGVLYPKDAQVATLTTDKAGNASVSGLYPGKYYVKRLLRLQVMSWMKKSMMWKAVMKVTR